MKAKIIFSDKSKKGTRMLKSKDVAGTLVLKKFEYYKSKAQVCS
jgi:hypothetical protein